MNTIALNGMKFYAYHGYYEEERILGAYYLLDVSVNVDFTKAGQNDELVDTINYENIYQICKEVMEVSAKLLEHIVQKIELRLTEYYPSISGVSIVLKKLNPPLGASVHSSQVSIEKDYNKRCSRCKTGFICHSNASCWCHSYTLSETVSSALKRDFKGCLCEDCLSEYG